MKVTKELRSLGKEELAARRVEFKKELLKLNVQVSSGSGVSNPGRVRQLKKNIARTLTLEKEQGVKS